MHANAAIPNAAPDPAATNRRARGNAKHEE
jgi:hypothetical protein